MRVASNGLFALSVGGENKDDEVKVGRRERSNDSRDEGLPQLVRHDNVLRSEQYLRGGG